FRFCYRLRCRAWDAVTPRVWIGSTLTHGEANAAVRLGVTAVLDLTAEFSAPRPFRELRYRNIQILDLTAPRLDQLQEMVEFIEQESERGIVFIHCKIGFSRTGAAAGAYLLYSGKAKTAAEAVELLRRARPTLIVRPEIVAALSAFARAVSPRLN
ncbi:MAG: dual specificity protein phosphatase family protein, partial [Verrucomicrobiaceae bacterium]|nr:dual specificity protein phosphatase family protein [Verrucomicrobiaceae bacterium]